MLSRSIAVRVYVKQLWVATHPVLWAKSSNVVVQEAGSRVVVVSGVSVSVERVVNVIVARAYAGLKLYVSAGFHSGWYREANLADMEARPSSMQDRPLMLKGTTSEYYATECCWCDGMRGSVFDSS